MGKKVDLKAPPKQKKMNNEHRHNHKSSTRPNKRVNYAQNMNNVGNYGAEDAIEQGTPQAQESSGKTSERQKPRNKQEKISSELAKIQEQQSAKENMEDKAAKFVAKQFIAYYAGSAVANSKKVDQELDKATIKSKKAKNFTKTFTIITIVLTLGVFFFLVFFVVMFFYDIVDSSGTGSGGLATGSYYPIDCQDVTVMFVDDNYEPIGSSTYSLEDYVAGVLQGEVGEFQNIEVYKAFAIAARSYFLSNHTNCTIESSARQQVFREITTTTNNTNLMKQATRETEGIVLLNSMGKIYNSEYDAFCYVEKNDDYYILSQKEEQIPVSWVDQHINSFYYKNCPCDAGDASKPECFNEKGEWQDGGHGRGISQWGSYYLATEKNYNYEDLIAFYLGDQNISLSKRGFMSSVAGLDIKKTKGSVTNLHEPITTFLESHGSSLTEYNRFIKENVKQAGVGTREGVVTAAVSSINYLYDNYKYNIPYFWGGKHTEVGISSAIGTSGYSKSDCSECSGIEYYYHGFDCTGFVSWAIRNGGFKFSSTSDYRGLIGSNYCHQSNQNCLGQPGDVLETDSHDMLIVSVDEANGNYYVAEAAGGSTGLVINTYGIHSDKYYVVKMDSFYNNKSNIDQNY